MEHDEHLPRVLCYVERNPLRARLARRAEDWPWGSCHVRQHRGHELYPLLGECPVPRPKGWLARGNLPADQQEETMIRDAIQRKGPVGSAAWVEQTARALGLEQSLRPRGRPVGWRKRTGPGGKRI